jgi:hypothetical protein
MRTRYTIFKLFKQGNQWPTRVSWKIMNPFICKQQILRVEGWPQKSQLPFEQKHQAILPPKHHLTKQIIEEEHKCMLHAGCQLLHSSLQQRYWIVYGKNVIKRIIHHCLICHKLRANTIQQLMGQLPNYRVELVRLFISSGTDCVGPFYIRSGSRWTKTRIKCYVAVFVCLATWAMHLEVVSDITSQVFLAALRTFISCRGRCACICSNNGTTFVGADKELHELHTLFNSGEHQRLMTE